MSSEEMDDTQALVTAIEKLLAIELEGATRLEAPKPGPPKVKPKRRILKAKRSLSTNVTAGPSNAPVQDSSVE